MNTETQKRMRCLSRILFGLYILLLFYMMFFSEQWGRSPFGNSFHYNLVPFREIQRYLTHYRQIGVPRTLLNLGGNVAGFLPFGFLVPVLRQKPVSGWRTVFLGFELSLVIEISQLASRAGSFDVDDLMLNTLGAALGYGLYRLQRRKKEKYIEKEI